MIKKRREQEPAPLLTINGETLQAMYLDDVCRYLGCWGTGNGDMRATKEAVRQKIITARGLIRCHPLTPELVTELFTSKGMGVFRNALWYSEIQGIRARGHGRACVLFPFCE